MPFDMLLLISAGGVRCHNICVHTRVWEIDRSPREEIQFTFVSFNFVLLPSDTFFNSQSPASKYVATNVNWLATPAVSAHCYGVLCAVLFFQKCNVTAFFGCDAK